MSVEHRELIEARTAREFLKVIEPNGKLFSSEFQRNIFRGQADAAWSVIPSVLRSGVTIPYEGTRRVCPLITNRDQINAELETIRQFAIELNEKGHHVPCEEILTTSAYPMQYLDQANRLGRGEMVWPPREYHSLIALAQHNGLPTRFVDFTYHPYVAAYFAASGACRHSSRGGYSGEICVHAIAGINVVQSYEFRQNRWDELLGESRKGYCYQLIEAPSFFNDNLKAQRACFLAYLQFAPEKNEPCEVHSLEEFFESESREALSSPIPIFTSRLYKITLAASHADELLRLLRRVGIDAGSMVPSIAGCVAAMYERCAEEPRERTRKARS